MDNIGKCTMTNQSGPPTFKLFQRISPTTAWIFLVLECIFFLLCVVGNTLVLITYSKSYKIRAIPHNVFIVALAIADLVLGVFTIPMHVYQNVIPNIMHPDAPLPPHYLDKEMCLAVLVSISHPLTWSATTLVLIAADRLLATMWPLRYHKIMSHWKAITFVVLAWILTSVSIYVGTAMADLVTYNQSLRCALPYQYPPELRYTVIILWGTAQLVLCYALYAVIIIGMCCGPTQVTHQTRLTRMMAIVLVVFTICVVPFFIMNLVGENLTRLPRVIFSALAQAFLSLMHLNSCINPIIYSFAHKTFRHRFWQMICCGNSREERSSSNHNEQTVYEENIVLVEDESKNI